MESKCDYAASISIVILDVVTSSSHHQHGQWPYLALQSAGIHVCYVLCVCFPHNTWIFYYLTPCNERGGGRLELLCPAFQVFRFCLDSIF